jgi:hypothetical protein
MVGKTFFHWPLQPSTVIGVGILTGTIFYFVTGDPVWAGIAAALVKILVPDNTGSSDQVFGAISALAAAFGRPLNKSDSDR